MNYDALGDYIHGLRARRNQLWALHKDDEADWYDRFADAIDFPVRHMRYGTKLTQDEVGGYLRNLLILSNLSEIEAHVPLHRANAVYQAVMKLAKAMKRLEDGKPASRFFGLL